MPLVIIGFIETAFSPSDKEIFFESMVLPCKSYMLKVALSTTILDLILISPVFIWLEAIWKVVELNSWFDKGKKDKSFQVLATLTRPTFPVGKLVSVGLIDPAFCLNPNRSRLPDWSVPIVFGNPLIEVGIAGSPRK